MLEHCADRKKLGAKTLFATHYHELTELENTLPGVKNYNIAIKSRGDDLVFLRRILPGGADRSYGIEVAKLAGLPEAVVKKARTILRVDCPALRSSLAPMRVKIRSTTPIRAARAGTKDPTWAISVMRATCRM